MTEQRADLNDPALVTEVDLARAAAQEEAGDERVGAHVSYHVEDEAAVTHLFEADKPGYHGWRWAVTITSAGPDTDVTVSEVVLLPGATALVAPDWIPWQDRVQVGDLGVGDLLPSSPDDPRLVPAYVESDDPAVEAVALEVGLGRQRVMARPARLDAAARWHQSEFGPRSDMARSAPAHCGTCAFYLPLAGSLKAAFGTCGNEMSPADAHVVHAEYGCGAHSEAEVEQPSPVLVADLIYDDAQLDVEPIVPAQAAPPASAEATVAEAMVAEPAPVESAVESVVELPEAAPVESAVEPEVAEAAVVVEEQASVAEPVAEPESGEEPSVGEPEVAVVVEEQAVAESAPVETADQPVAEAIAVPDEQAAAVESGDEAPPAPEGFDQLAAFPEIGAPVSRVDEPAPPAEQPAPEIPLDADQLTAFPEIDSGT